MKTSFADASKALAIALSAAAGTPHPAAASASTPRARAVDIQHVAIDLRFDWQARQALGSGTITLAPLRATDTVSLDAGRLATSPTEPRG